MNAANIRDSSEQWQLFIDASSTILKAVLLHNANEFHSISVEYVTNTKETYTNMKINRLQKTMSGTSGKCMLNFYRHQTGYTKYSCFLLLWNRSSRDSHYDTKSLPRIQSLTPGAKNVVH